MNSGRLAHWQNVYKEKAENQVSWFQETPAISLELIEAIHPKFDSAIIDIGGGAARILAPHQGRCFGCQADRFDLKAANARLALTLFLADIPIADQD